METEIQMDPGTIRKARVAHFSGMGLVLLWNVAVFLAVDGSGMLFHIDIHIAAFFVLRFVILLIMALLFLSFLTVFFIDPYVRKISHADSYSALMEAYKENQEEGGW